MLEVCLRIVRVFYLPLVLALFVLSQDSKLGDPSQANIPTTDLFENSYNESRHFSLFVPSFIAQDFSSHAMSTTVADDSGIAARTDSIPESESDTIIRLRNENKTLQLRVLGVNELARLFQDKTDLVQVLTEKNKRLEVAVVRLEHRCSNFERKMKSLGSSGSASAKSGQSPFIPGPSRQILEALMRENTDLKKALNHVTEKKGSGYLEAVVSEGEEVGGACACVWCVYSSGFRLVWRWSANRAWPNFSFVRKTKLE